MAKFEVYTQVDITLPVSEYPIIVCRNGLGCSTLWQSLVSSNQVLIVTNQTIAPLYLAAVQSVFSGKQCDSIILPDGEAFKNKDNLFIIYESLMQNHHHRDTTVVALGGGVIGDMAGFAASTYQRGVSFIQIPTTLLAQVDASVGGKTAINHPLGKNMIGSFYQPDAVVIDINSLSTLPEREFKSGLAEMIKYALLVGGEFLDKLVSALQIGLDAYSLALPDLIAECCRIKARFVIEDEKETGQRALLNLGHTFAHALEAYTHYQYWLHGEAVAIGLYCAALLSFNEGLTEMKWVEQVEAMLRYAGLPHKIPKFVDLQELKKLMAMDKKVKNNQLRFILMQQPGFCYLSDKITENNVNTTLISATEAE